MGNELQINRIKEIRGEILNLLYSVAPRPVEARTIITTLMDSGHITTPDISRHISYLADRKYISMISEENAAKLLHGIVPTNAFIRLTANGADIVERIKSDEGITPR